MVACVQAGSGENWAGGAFAACCGTDGGWSVLALQDCVNKTIARIKSKLEREDKRVLNHVVYGLRSSRRSVDGQGPAALPFHGLYLGYNSPSEAHQ